MTADYTQLQNSGFLDYDSYRSTAPLPSNGTPVNSFTINVGLVLDRASDPTALLDADWASRQQQIANLTASNTLWSTYGADTAKYQQALSDLAGLGIQTVSQVDPTNGYVASSAANRTIWVQLDASTFQTLFNTQVLSGTDQSGNSINYWSGNLSLPTSLTALGVKGLEFDSSLFVPGLVPNPGSGTAVTLPQGPQSPGNDVPSGTSPNINPQIIASSNYHYPLTNPSFGTTTATGTIGLVEPGIGAALPETSSSSFSTLLTDYLQTVYNSSTIMAASVTNVAPGGPSYSSGGGERSLDVGVVAAIDPQSPLVLYAGSGDKAHAGADAYTAYQSAIWDTTNNPQVITSSYFNWAEHPSAESPFTWAAKQLYVDAALRNMTVLTANGDGGTGVKFGNGVTNVATGQTSPYEILVGGTSLSSPHNAETDPTLDPPAQGAPAVALPIVPNAQNGVLATLWQLVRSGMVAMPYPAGQTPSSTATLIETVWNEYSLSGSTMSKGYFANNTSAGGVDPTEPEPSYQLAFGLTPTTSDPGALVGRGTPDVAALAGGDRFWEVPQGDMTGLHGEGGTSAATPAWAALISQIDAVFADQGLPQLGYMNDLLYLAAAIFPGSFNDITVGNNTSSYTVGGTTRTVTDKGVTITPTGFGYQAGLGYDMATGLGSPDGLLLARTLSEIAHSQMFFAAVPNTLSPGGPTGWQSGAAESLLFQSNSTAAANVSLKIGGTSTSFASAAAAAYAWSSQFAEQTLQPYFDPNLVVLFDNQSQGAVVQASVASNTALGIAINGVATTPPQGTLTDSFGFVTFTDGNGNTVEVARPVAIAETAGGQNDQLAIVRVRDASTHSDTLSFYRVDDLNGTISGLQPGSPGYAAAAQARAYRMTSGGASINTLSAGQYQQTALENVNAGDLIAFELTDNTAGTTYWGFSQANADSQAHLWNYGADTWGFQDGSGGNDFNDPVFQLDFTSASGQGLLVGAYGLPKSTSAGNDGLLLETSQQTASWTISGTSVSGGNIAQLLQPGWSILGTGAFEGGSGSDVLLQSGQQLAEWQMSGTSVVGGGNLSDTLDTGWSVAAIGDLYGDTHDDLVLQNGQQLAVWHMNGPAVMHDSGDIGTLGAGWSIAGIADFNDDGRDDLLLQNGQQLAEWQMNGKSVAGGGPIGQTLGAGWSVAGVGDLNGDGNADILLQNGQQLAEWQMNGTSVVGGGNIGTLAAGWMVAGVGTFNNDGNADILLQNGQQLAEWQMNGTSVIGGGNIGPNLGPGWSYLAGAHFG